ncbi:hypothetical protein ACTTAL_18050 [Rhodobacter capsulatus]|uniref:hypothetical protein n=1 Tax=Rhodobacter capsulatus TaxID=1061 RepID=UPI0003D39916|nr:hypothetical protein [Rhodobacter capsulatus]ETD82818.1 hypothetical protein U703_11410 [Rhodobacter capsulatus YW1]ETD87964.1 hypothetical protein U713_14180 [Rhodobacter capsulatus YW2]
MLEGSRIAAGRWEALWRGPEPAFKVLHLEREVPGLSCAALGENLWQLSLPIPPGLLSDGVQTFVLRAGEEQVGHFTLIAGQPLESDLRAELDLLRAELDLLKRAFRRHCVESGA